MNFSLIWKWFVLVGIQVFLLNEVDYLQMATPFLFILFIINLPLEISRIPLLLIGFVTGLIVDVFGNTIGIHTCATTLIAYLRPWILRVMAPTDLGNEVPSFRNFTIARYMEYATVMTVIHHALFFIMENGSTNMLFTVILRIVESSVFTLLLIYSIEYFKYKKFVARR